MVAPTPMREFAMTSAARRRAKHPNWFSSRLCHCARTRKLRFSISVDLAYQRDHLKRRRVCGKTSVRWKAREIAPQPIVATGRLGVPGDHEDACVLHLKAAWRTVCVILDIPHCDLDRPL